MPEESLVQQKLNEYLTQLAPLDRAAGEVALARRMLRARTEEELASVAPSLGALAEALQVSAIDMLLAADREAFVRRAVQECGLTIDQVRLRVLESSATAREDLRLLGFGESL